jgi:hypothetical protein
VPIQTVLIWFKGPSKKSSSHDTISFTVTWCDLPHFSFGKLKNGRKCVCRILSGGC